MYPFTLPVTGTRSWPVPDRDWSINKRQLSTDGFAFDWQSVRGNGDAVPALRAAERRPEDRGAGQRDGGRPRPARQRLRLDPRPARWPRDRLLEHHARSHHHVRPIPFPPSISHLLI